MDRRECACGPVEGSDKSAGLGGGRKTSAPRSRVANFAQVTPIFLRKIGGRQGPDIIQFFDMATYPVGALIG
jgi:hypothetical protein